MRDFGPYNYIALSIKLYSYQDDITTGTDTHAPYNIKYRQSRIKNASNDRNMKQTVP